MTGTDNRSQASILRIFNSSIDQLCSENSLPQLSDAQRDALNQALLNTVEILGAEEDQERSRFAQTTPRNARKRQKLSLPTARPAAVPGFVSARNTPQAQPEVLNQVQAQGIGNQEMTPQPRPSPQLQVPVPLPQLNTMQAAETTVPQFSPMGALGTASPIEPDAGPIFLIAPQMQPDYNPQQQEQQQQQDYNTLFEPSPWLPGRQFSG